MPYRDKSKRAEAQRRYYVRNTYLEKARRRRARSLSLIPPPNVTDPGTDPVTDPLEGNSKAEVLNKLRGMMNGIH